MRQSFFKAKVLPNAIFGKSCIHGNIRMQQQLQTSSDLIELYIDDKPVQVPAGTTVLKVNKYYALEYAIIDDS